MPLSLLNHSALALFAQRTRIPTSARSIGFCAIWVCISSSSSSQLLVRAAVRGTEAPVLPFDARACAIVMLLSKVAKQANMPLNIETIPQLFEWQEQQ